MSALLEGEPLRFILLALAGVVAGFVNSIAGAGSLLTLPALIFTGLDPSAANATNRVAVLAQTAAATVTFRRGGAPGLKYALVLAAVASVFAGAGAYAASLLSEDSLRVAMALAMVAFLGLSFVAPKKRMVEGAPGAREPSLTPGLFVGFSAMGLYAGFLQAGVGVLMLLYLSWVHGISLVHGNATKVVTILVFTVVALVVFVVQGEVIDVSRGAVLAASGVAGAWFGARSALRAGERWVRVILVVVVGAAAVRLALDALSLPW